jgi:hypothetical protein
MSGSSFASRYRFPGTRSREAIGSRHWRIRNAWIRPCQLGAGGPRKRSAASSAPGRGGLRKGAGANSVAVARDVVAVRTVDVRGCATTRSQLTEPDADLSL